MHIHELTTPCQRHADACVEKSYEAQAKGEAGRMWSYSLYAHVGYLGDLIASVVILPFTLIGLLFGSIHALYIWDSKGSKLLNSSVDLFTSKLHRMCASLLGATVSPAGAYYYRDREILWHAMGVAAIGMIGLALIHNPPNRWSIDTDKKMKFGWGF